jgi:hypothetical protein
MFDYQGRIGTRSDGKMTWDFMVSLDGGAAAPNMLLSSEINARDNPWPAGFTLANLKGDVRVRREGVSWDQVSGVNDEATITTSGLIDLRDAGEPDFVTVRLANAQVDRSALNMIAAGSAGRAEELWDRFQPEGRYDALIGYRSDAPAAQAATVTIEPRQITLLAGGQRVPVTGHQGAVRIDRQHAAFDNMLLQIHEQQLARAERRDDVVLQDPPSQLSVNGSWTFAGEKPSFEIAGDWTSGRFHSPLIPEFLEVIGQQSQADRLREFDPAGVFDMRYQASRGDPDMPPDYRLDVRPHSVEFLLRGTRVSLASESGDITLTPGFVTLDQIVGACRLEDRDARFAVDGGIKTSDPLDAALSIDYQGPLRSSQVVAFLPDAVNNALTALEFRDPGGSTLKQGWLHVRKSEAEGGGWQTEFTGRIETRGAEFVAGLRFSEVDGWVDLDVSHESGRPPRLSAVSRADRAVVLGRTLFALEAPFSFNQAGDAIEIPSAHARSGDGAIAASATVGVGGRRDYRVRVDLAGVPMGSVFTAPPNDSASAAPATAPADRRVPGKVYGSLSLSGLRGEPASKRGRGIVRVVNGHLSSIPLVLQALQVMQLTLPLSGGLDFADADLYIVGDTAHFEHILFESTVGDSAALQLLGEGTLDLTTMEVTARFRPRSGIAILRDIIGGIGDMLYEIEVTGPLSAPQARVVPLP